jgi:hypothetical protein
MAEPGRCATCRWWKAYAEWPQDAPRPCLLTETALARSHGALSDVCRTHPASHAHAHGGAGAVLYTAPDFGCTQYEAKPDA